MESENKNAAAAALKSPSESERRAAAGVLGSIRTEAKREASRRNLAERPPDKLGGRPMRPLEESPCRCGAGDSLTGHKWDCPRGQSIKRREKAGLL